MKHSGSEGSLLVFPPNPTLSSLESGQPRTQVSPLQKVLGNPSRTRICSSGNQKLQEDDLSPHNAPSHTSVTRGGESPWAIRTLSMVDPLGAACRPSVSLSPLPKWRKEPGQGGHDTLGGPPSPSPDLTPWCLFPQSPSSPKSKSSLPASTPPA